MSGSPDGLSAFRDESGDVLVRAPGCFASLVLWSAIASIPLSLGLRLPKLVQYLAATLLGVACVRIFVATVRSRWRVATPDFVQMMGEDLQRLLGASLEDFRLRFPKGTPWSDRLLHEGLYVLKWTGYLLIFSGFGAALYQLVVSVGST